MTEVVVRATDTFKDLKDKIDTAVFLGTIQSTYTDFPYLRTAWRDNCNEERLLGVSLTGIQDRSRITNAQLNLLHDYAQVQNQYYAKKLGIAASTAVTCVKPSGTVSQLVDASSGLHARWAPYYIRRVRLSTMDPLSSLLFDSGFPLEPDKYSEGNYVASFYVKAPEGAKVASTQTAKDQLQTAFRLKDYWTDHNPSCTIYIEDQEWDEIGEALYSRMISNHEIGGLSFLPKTNHTYEQAPYETITEEEYYAGIARQPVIDYSQLSKYEKEDTTAGPSSCEGNLCSLGD